MPHLTGLFMALCSLFLVHALRLVPGTPQSISGHTPHPVETIVFQYRSPACLFTPANSS